MMRFRKNSDSLLRFSDQGNGVFRFSERRCELPLMGILVFCFMAFSVLFSLFLVLRDPPSDHLWSFADARSLQDRSVQVSKAPKSELLGGLLQAGFHEKSCFSRYHSSRYRKDLSSSFKPSPYLLSRLRNYEALHGRCAPHTESYNKSLNQVNDSRHGCNYVVWISFSGLGNRILTLASAFLYALLTNRVLLVDPGLDMPDLFCEPFPGGSWFLPSDFPFKKAFDQNSPHRFGNSLKKGSGNLNSLGFTYLHLVHDYDDHDKLFFCDDEQKILRHIPWLLMKSNNYFIPSLFLIPSFQKELANLFPNKSTVFHFIARYLLHPTNPVWGLITRYYEAYLSKANQRIGIQIRIMDVDQGPFQHVLDQILACTTSKNILPRIKEEEGGGDNPSLSKAVLITSLSSWYSEKLKNMYWERSSVTGESIGVYQASHEGYQQSEKRGHNEKAWAEMYLLSLCDVLVTSSWSTFGYVAQGLGGLTPYILSKPPENRTVPEPACVRGMSMEPCFHAPPLYDCKAKRGTDTGALVPHVKHCEDMSWGLKLVDS